MQALYRLFDLRELPVLTDVMALAMLTVPVVVELESLVFHHGCLLVLQLGRKRFIILLLVVEQLALSHAVAIVAFVYVAPVAEAKPAELVSTVCIRTPHANTALVFLDRLAALRTLLSIGL